MSNRRLMIVLAAAPVAFTSGVTSVTPDAWRQLPPIPDPLGFAGSYAGVVSGTLFVAGGANFPDRPPWENGTKTWYDRVFTLEQNAAAWRESGRLPKPAAYGVSVTIEEGTLLIGGGNAQTNFDDVWLVRRDRDGRLVSEAWPRLPRPLAMAAGVSVGRTVYVAGGIETPSAAHAQSTVFALDLDRRTDGWREIPPCPGPGRMLAVAGAWDGTLCLFGGAQLVTDDAGKAKRVWLRDAWRYAPARGWARCSDLPRAIVAAPGPAPVVGGKLLVIGGDDGTQVNVAPSAHQGFPREVLGYDPSKDEWRVAGAVPFSLVTTPAVRWDDQIVVPGGEARPGVRSSAVWAGRLNGEK